MLNDIRIVLDPFTQAYIECALWSSTDDEGDPLDANYNSEDFATETLLTIVEECKKFQARAGTLISNDFYKRSTEQWSVEEFAGHDFWLTRVGHGAGFWDGDWTKEAGEKLTTLSKTFKEVNLIIGDDGKIYQE